MPIFYNTSAPTPTTKNNITDVATSYGVRDFLLNLNLLPTYPLISTSLNGSPKIGEPVLDTLVNNGSNVIPLYLPLETNGILFKDLNIAVNTFQNNASNANALTEMNYINAIPNANFPNSNWPQGIQNYPTAANQDVNDYGLVGKTIDGQFRKKNVIKNLYLDVTKQIDMADFITLTPLDITQQVSGYLDTYGGLNLGGSGAIQAANVIGSVLNGQGLGLAKGGIVTNFDIRSSLAGRVLGATGLINDTKLGMIGGQQLALALANNAAFNVQQEILGSLNVQNNILSLIKGDGLVGLRPSYKITIPASTGGRVLDTAGKILGFTIPRSYLDDSGSIFQTENNNAGNIERANAMILNTGKGQIQALLTNVRANQIGTNAGGTDDPSKSLFRSGYAPAFANNKGETQITDALVYAFSSQGAKINLFSTEDGIIADLSYLREEKTSDDGFKSPEQNFTGNYEVYDSVNDRTRYVSNSGYDERKLSDVGFTWTSNPSSKAVNARADYDEMIGDKKSLLVKTQKLFNSVGMKNVISRKGDMNKHSTQIQTANGQGFSKGNAVLQGHLFDESTGRYSGGTYSAEETYCRSWTTLDRYDTVSKMVRSHGLWDSRNVPYRFNTEGSVLDDYGFAKIAPYTTDSPTDPKKFMLSIENLAWSDDLKLLPQCEIGPGDLQSGKQGRIMWFPPYDISFSENSSVNWESNNFIGRGESVYTYNNTERSGNLSFKIVVDHPSYANAFRGPNGPDDHYINSFWAGCIDPNSEIGKRLTVDERSVTVNADLTIPVEKVAPPEPAPGPLKVYFPNDNTEVYYPYENGLSASTQLPIDYSVNKNGAGQGLGTYKADFTPGNHNNGKKADGEGWPDRYNFGLNYSLSGSSEAAKESISEVGANGEKLYGYFDPNTTDYITNHLSQLCPHCVATIKGGASSQGSPEYNIKLAEDRSVKILADIKQKWWPKVKEGLIAKGLKITDSDFEKRFKVSKTHDVVPADKDISVLDGVTNKYYKVKESVSGCYVCDKEVMCIGLNTVDCRALKDRICPTDSIGCKKDRYASVSFTFDENLAKEDIAQPDPIITKQNKRINTRIENKFYSECGYFDQLTDIDPFVFDSFREKIRYFHPAFHSTTPEGLNSRLTFLLQCTRQGPTKETQGANNLAFGRAPVCILRIGDFYNTKIVIDSLSIDYEPLVWDLNPEGVGVQPMIANVTLSFKFIGASTLMGPLNKLQNALSFNYFANAQVYDPRADYFAQDSDGANAKPNEIPKYILKNGISGTASPDITITETIIKDNTPEIDQEKAAEQAAVEEAVEAKPASTSIIDDSAVINCFGYEGTYMIDESDPTDIKVTMMLYWNAKVDVENPELNTSHKAFVYIQGSDREKVIIGHIRILPNSAGSLIFQVYDDKDGNPVSGDKDQLLSFAGTTNKARINFQVDFYIDDATKAKFVLDAWNSTGGSNGPSMVQIAWQEENGAAINAGFSKSYGFPFSNQI